MLIASSFVVYGYPVGIGTVRTPGLWEVFRTVLKKKKKKFRKFQRG
jgi:tetrahydromethanopterin S-methyltransferase subunit H